MSFKPYKKPTSQNNKIEKKITTLICICFYMYTLWHPGGRVTWCLATTNAYKILLYASHKLSVVTDFEFFL